MGYSVHVLFLPDYVEKQHRASMQEASFMMSCVGVSSLLSRICVGALSNDDRNGPELTYFSTVGITAIISLFLPVFASSSGGRIAYGLMLGLYTGGVFSLQSSIALKLTGIENFALAFGAVMFAQGLGFLTGSPIASSIYGITERYDHVFLSSAIMFFASCCFGFLSVLKSRDSEKRRSPNTDDNQLGTEIAPLSVEQKTLENNL